MTARSSDANDDDNDNDAAAHRSSSSSSISISSSETKEQQHEHSMTETETETTERSQVEAAVSLCRQARTLWLRNATAADDLDRVEELYRKALNSKRGSGIRNKNKNKRKRISPTDNFTTTLVAALPPEEYRKAGERLSLLYLQSGRAYKAKAGLKYLGFECRLSERILNYPLSNRFIPVPPTATAAATATAYKVGKSGKGNKNKNKNNNNMPKPPCCVVDDFLSESELRHLRKVFGDVNSSYWSSHNYIIDEEPPAPYFSYVIDLKSKSKSSNNNNNNKTANTERGILRTIVDKILRCGPVVAETDTFRNLRREANYVELWAHNRPHASGHQLHFDSDDEGRSRHNGEGYFPKHPIASTVLNLSSHARVGGPTLVTTQRLRNPATTHLSSVKGWLVPSKPGRLVVFDGSVLHGVIPGKGTIPPPMDNDNDNDNDEKEHRPRRVTLMMAFWKDIEVRTGSKPGSARPWPSASSSSSTLPPWAVELNRTDVAATCESSKSKHRWKDDTEKSVIPVKHVYELLDGTPVPKYYDNAEDGGGGGDGPYMPEYDRVFQGF